MEIEIIRPINCCLFLAKKSSSDEADAIGQELADLQLHDLPIFNENCNDGYVAVFRREHACKRAKIIGMSEGKYDVILVDDGICIKVKKNNLRTLPKYFQNSRPTVFVVGILAVIDNFEHEYIHDRCFWRRLYNLPPMDKVFADFIASRKCTFLYKPVSYHLDIEFGYIGIKGQDGRPKDIIRFPYKNYKLARVADFHEFMTRWKICDEPDVNYIEECEIHDAVSSLLQVDINLKENKKQNIHHMSSSSSVIGQINEEVSSHAALDESDDMEKLLTRNTSRTKLCHDDNSSNPVSSAQLIKSKDKFNISPAQQSTEHVPKSILNFIKSASKQIESEPNISEEMSGMLAIKRPLLNNDNKINDALTDACKISLQGSSKSDESLGDGGEFMDADEQFNTISWIYDHGLISTLQLFQKKEECTNMCPGLMQFGRCACNLCTTQYSTCDNDELVLRKGVDIKLQISHVYNAIHYAGFITDVRECGRWKHFTSCADFFDLFLKYQFRNPANRQCIRNANIGDLVVFQRTVTTLYRAKITNIQYDEIVRKKNFTIQLVDTGNLFASVPENKLFVLPDEFKNIPYGFVEFFISNLLPPTTDDGNWPLEANKFVRKKLIFSWCKCKGSGYLKAKILSSVNNRVWLENLHYVEIWEACSKVIIHPSIENILLNMGMATKSRHAEDMPKYLDASCSKSNLLSSKIAIGGKNESVRRQSTQDLTDKENVECGIVTNNDVDNKNYSSDISSYPETSNVNELVRTQSTQNVPHKKNVETENVTNNDNDDKNCLLDNDILSYQGTSNANELVRTQLVQNVTNQKIVESESSKNNDNGDKNCSSDSDISSYQETSNVNELDHKNVTNKENVESESATNNDNVDKNCSSHINVLSYQETLNVNELVPTQSIQSLTNKENVEFENSTNNDDDDKDCSSHISSYQDNSQCKSRAKFESNISKEISSTKNYIAVDERYNGNGKNYHPVLNDDDNNSDTSLDEINQYEAVNSSIEENETENDLDCFFSFEELREIARKLPVISNESIQTNDTTSSKEERPINYGAEFENTSTDNLGHSEGYEQSKEKDVTPVGGDDNCSFNQKTETTKVEIHPTIFWWQENKDVYVKVNVVGLENCNVRCTKETLHFSAFLTNDRMCDLNFDLFAWISQRKTTHIVNATCVIIYMRKLIYRKWERLTKLKNNSIKYDPDHVITSEESDDDDYGDLDPIAINLPCDESDQNWSTSDGEEREFHMD